MISPCYTSPQEVEVGMWITPDQQGKGYGKKALQELLDRLMEEGVKKVVYEADDDNLPSIGLAKALGFELNSDRGLLKFVKVLKNLQ